ncbi:hypothetical protein CDD81_6633 [Ophiocordyceps australis]|uniref:Uncharacterized protein n=1 Tax=Ophiocordyceps australis TaxID=1399860 RepID=A0A2C5Y5D7_9HYPO|nr:hypothetical protein CDD81_6633 [Ophiocordyceps australis]
MPHYIEEVCSVRQHKALFRKEGVSINNLKLPAASSWSRLQLLACKVIVPTDNKGHRKMLPCLKKYKIKDENMHEELHRFLDGPPVESSGLSDHSLIRSHGLVGLVWAALADVTARERTLCSAETKELERIVESKSPEARTTKVASLGKTLARSFTMTLRPRRAQAAQIEAECFLEDDQDLGCDSDSEPEPDSEPAYESSSSGEVSLAPSVQISERSHTRDSPLETLTVDLLRSVLRHILLFGGRQKTPVLAKVLEVRLQGAKLSYESRTQDFSATDDGGICLRALEKGVYHVRDASVAIFECKRQVTAFTDGRPSISDACLGQMACEAILARPRQKKDSVIIIHAAQQYVRLFEFVVSASYRDEFPNLGNSTFLQVHCTGWLDLTTRVGREALTANICALIESVRQERAGSDETVKSLG